MDCFADGPLLSVTLKQQDGLIGRFVDGPMPPSTVKRADGLIDGRTAAVAFLNKPSLDKRKQRNKPRDVLGGTYRKMLQYLYYYYYLFILQTFLLFILCVIIVSYTVTQVMRFAWQKVSLFL